MAGNNVSDKIIFFLFFADIIIIQKCERHGNYGH